MPSTLLNAPAQILIGDPSAPIVTTNATVTEAARFSLGTRAAGVVRVRMMARDRATQDAKVWEGVVGVRRDLDGSTAGLAAMVVVAVQNTAGASAWVLAGAALSTGHLQVTVQGEAGKTIDWAGVADIVWLEQVP